jgi:hypothetical protein
MKNRLTRPVDVPETLEMYAKKQSDAPVLWCTAAANVSQIHLSTKLQ